MSRRRSAEPRSILPDPKYKSVQLAKFINLLMMSGKKALAERIVYSALDSLAEKRKKEPLELFLQAVENAKPFTEVKSRRVGGSTYQVPVEVRPVRRDGLAMRWIIDAARKRKAQAMEFKLFSELDEALDKRGGAVKKREEMHRMAEANKAFSHYRW